MDRNGSLRTAQLVLFARNFIKHPKMLGSLVPSSRFLINEALDRVDWSRTRTVVEYGPGIGNFTTAILARMRPDARLVAIETNEEFVEFMKKEIPDPRLQIVHGSAGDVQRILHSRGHAHADCIVSGIPFSTLPDGVRAEILTASRAALAPNGVFLVYQFSSRVLPDLERIFGSVERRFVPLNILPARLFMCGRKAA